MGVLDVLSGLATVGGQAAQGEAIDQATVVKNAITQATAKREDDAAKVAALLHGATIRHLNAESDKLANPDADVVGHVTDNTGNLFAIHKDGSLSAAAVRPTVPAQVNADAGAGTPVMPAGGPATDTGSAQGSPPVATPAARPVASAPAPNFGPRKTYQRMAVNVDGKPGFALQDNEGNFVDPTTHQPISGKVEPYTPPDKPTIVPTAGGIVRVGSTGDATPVTDAQGNPVIKAGPNTQSNPQMSAAKANLESARKTMDDFEEKLRQGTATYTPTDATKGALSSSPETMNAKGLSGALESFAGNQAGSSLREKNPELANYLKAKKLVAEAILNTHKRPNQTQFEIEQELSSVGPRSDGFTGSDAAGQIAQSKDRRDRMFNEVFGGAGNAGPSPDHSKMTDAEFAAAWKAGKFKKP